MNSLRTSALVGILLVSATISSAPAQQPSSSAVIKQQLPPGNDPQTFAFTYTGRVIFTQEPAFPVTIAVTGADHKPVYKMTAKDGSPFTLSTDLPQGTYWVESFMAPENDKIYWGAFGPQFFINATGEVTNGRSMYEGELVHQKKLTVLNPNPHQPPATTTEKRPLIQWQALPGAVRYQLYWLVEQAPLKIVDRGTGETTATEYRLPQDVTPDRQYELGINAYGADGRQIGYWSAAYFYTPGGAESFAKNPAPVSATKGMPYLGLVPRKLDGNGVYVDGVRGDSPAMKAGLQPGDVLITFNGQSLTTMGDADFVKMVRALAIGTKVPVEYLRNKEKKSTEVTIEAMP